MISEDGRGSALLRSVSATVSCDGKKKNVSLQPSGHCGRALDSHVSSESVEVVVGLLALDDAVVLQRVELAILQGDEHKQRVNGQDVSKMVHFFSGYAEGARE